VDARYSGDIAASAAALIAIARPGDVAITLGAGDGDRVGTALLNYLSR
jgi:UDP-N-acetylmuramate--alanine ligase